MQPSRHPATLLFCLMPSNISQSLSPLLAFGRAISCIQSAANIAGRKQFPALRVRTCPVRLVVQQTARQLREYSAHQACWSFWRTLDNQPNARTVQIKYFGGIVNGDLRIGDFPIGHRWQVITQHAGRIAYRPLCVQYGGNRLTEGDGRELQEHALFLIFGVRDAVEQRLGGKDSTALLAQRITIDASEDAIVWLGPDLL